MSTEPYQEEEGSTFESNGRVYDLNFIFREVAHLPILTIKVNRLKWVVDPKKPMDQARIDAADLEAPCLVVYTGGQELLIDGEHRLLKALQQHKPTLRYRRVSFQLLERALIRVNAPPAHDRW